MSLQNWDLAAENLPAVDSTITPRRKRGSKHKNSADGEPTNKENVLSARKLRNKLKSKESRKSTDGVKEAAEKDDSTATGSTATGSTATGSTATGSESLKKPARRKNFRKDEVALDESAVSKDDKGADESVESVKKPTKKKKLQNDDTVDEESSPTKKSRKASKGKFTISADPAIAPSAETADAEEDTAEDTEDKKPKKPKMSVGRRKSIKYKERKRKEKLDRLKSTMPKDKLEEYLNPTAPDLVPEQASLNYLRLWKSTRDVWKFSKVRQTWLLKNWQNTASIKKEDFSVLLEYMQPLKGLARESTIKESTELLETHKDSADKKSKTIASRATQILQILD